MIRSSSGFSADSPAENRRKNGKSEVLNNVEKILLDSGGI